MSRNWAPHRIGLARVGLDMRILGAPQPTGPRAPNGAGRDQARISDRAARRYRATTGRRRYQCSECDSHEHNAARCPRLRREVRA